MSQTPLHTAKNRVANALTMLLTSDNDTKRLWAVADEDPEAAIKLADSLCTRVATLAERIELMVHEATLAKQQHKGA